MNSQHKAAFNPGQIGKPTAPAETDPNSPYLKTFDQVEHSEMSDLYQKGQLGTKPVVLAQLVAIAKAHPEHREALLSVIKQAATEVAVARQASAQKTGTLHDLAKSAGFSRTGRFPPKAVNYDRLPDADGFWDQSIADAARQNAIRPPRPDGDIGSLIFFLNMAAMGWDGRAGRKKYHTSRMKPLSEAAMGWDGRAGRKSATTQKVAHKPYLAPYGLDKGAVSRGMGSMLYLIDRAKNHSKFHEMLIVAEDAGFTLMRRWGALTDSRATGNIAEKNERFGTLGEAQRQLSKIYREKTAKGYKDAFNSRQHRSPSTGEVLKPGEYPIGLDRNVGFGWGTQSTSRCIPALQKLVGELEEAKAEANAEARAATVEQNLAQALAYLSVVAREDNTMAQKLKGYIEPALRRIKGGPRFLPDTEGRKLIGALGTIINYIRKQTAYCGS